MRARRERANSASVAVAGGTGLAYDAFISYSHAADDLLAPALQAGMQRLAKPWNRRRALHVFRDETGLSTNPHLWSSIEAALDGSEWFVLLASPEAVRSEWVNREISRWLVTKSADRILPVVTDGTWSWNAATGALVGDAVPDALQAVLREEPRHLDLRWARRELDLDLRNSRFRAAVADVAATVHGVPKDELEGEDIRQHRRARLVARGAVSVLVLLVVIALVFGTIAAVERGRADRNASRATRAAARALVRGLISTAQTHVGDQRDLALLLGVEAYRRDPSAESAAPLLGVLTRDPALVGYLHSVVRATTSAVSSDGMVVAAGTENGKIDFWDLRTLDARHAMGAPVSASHHAQVASMAFVPGTHRVAVVGVDGYAQIWDADAHRPFGDPLRVTTSTPFQLTARQGSAQIAVSAPGEGFEIWDLTSRRRIGTIAFCANDVCPPGTARPGYLDIAYSADGARLCAGEGGSVAQLLAWDATSLAELSPDQEHGDPCKGRQPSGPRFAQARNGSVTANGDFGGGIQIQDTGTSFLLEGPGPVSSTSLSDDGRVLAATYQSGFSAMWHLDGTGAILTRSPLPSGSVGATAPTDGRPVNVVKIPGSVIVTSGDGRVAVTAVAESPPRLAAYDLRTDRLLSTFDTGPVEQRLLETHHVPKTQRGLPVLGPRTGQIPGSVVLDRTGQHAAAITFLGDVVVWNTTTGKIVGQPIIGSELTGSSATSVAFDPTSSELAIGNNDGTVERRRLPSLDPIGAPFVANRAALDAVSYQPSTDVLIISEAADGIDFYDPIAGVRMGFVYAQSSGLHLHNSDTAVLLERPPRHPAEISLSPEVWAAAACRVAGRNLTSDEWNRYLGPEVPYRRTCPTLAPG